MGPSLSVTPVPHYKSSMSTVAEELSKYAPDTPTLLTLGIFDGVHLGHQSLIHRLKERARELGLRPGVVTFDPHPLEVLQPDVRLPLLMTVDERVRFLTESGVPLVVPLTFTREVSELAPQEFVQLLMSHLAMSGLVLGPDFGLGRNRTGTIQTLEALGAQLGFSVESVPPYMIDNQVVSSTAIRGALARGDVSTATRMLGRRYTLSGTVGTTSRRGASLGFPTANLATCPKRALPRDGVYATIAYVSGERFPSVTNIGCRPTFGQSERVVETYILDFDRQLYGALLTIEFVATIREETTFRNQEDLVSQIRKDVATARTILGDSDK